MFRRLAVVKRIASSTERESKQRSRRPILKCVSLSEFRQRWLSALISNALNRNRQAGPISRAVRTDIISRSRGRKSRPHIKVSCPHVSMVRLARAELFDPSEVAILHVIGRVTRRCFFFGFDPVSGKNFNHRKVWIEEHLKTQAAGPAIGKSD